MHACGRAEGWAPSPFVFQYMGSFRLHYGRVRARREGETRGTTRDGSDDDGWGELGEKNGRTMGIHGGGLSRPCLRPTERAPLARDFMRSYAEGPRASVARGGGGSVAGGAVDGVEVAGCVG